MEIKEMLAKMWNEILSTSDVEEILEILKRYGVEEWGLSRALKMWGVSVPPESQPMKTGGGKPTRYEMFSGTGTSICGGRECE